MTTTSPNNGPYPGGLPPPLTMAGYALAHAAWSLSDLETGAALVPLSVIWRDGKVLLTRYEAPSQEEAIAAGKEAMANLDASVLAWAFARDGLMRDDNRTTDALSVDFWGATMPAPFTVIQLYEPFATGRFRLIGEPMLVVAGKVSEDERAKRIIAGVLQGVGAHPQVATLWPTWK
jgi:hypothetical protein